MSKKEKAVDEATDLGRAAGAELRKVRAPVESVLMGYFGGVLAGFKLKPRQEASVLANLTSIAPRPKRGDHCKEAWQIASAVGERFLDQGAARTDTATSAIDGLMYGLGLTTAMASQAIARMETTHRFYPNEEDPELSQP